MPAAEPVGPVRDDELSVLFAPIEGADRIALGVSGGADSLALLHLVDRWRRAKPGLHAIVLTVDHGLRKESRLEAANVVAAARKRGMKGRILSSDEPVPTSDIEAAARAMRYRLLLAAARRERATHLLLAHHRDDQAETLLLRLARGSGVFGLASMRRAIVVGDGAGRIVILRPFLDLPRVRLAATCAEAGLEAVADPMNADPRFARARLRRIMPLLVADGIGPVGLAATARRLTDTADAIDTMAGRFLAANVVADDLGVARLDPGAVSAEPKEIVLRALARIVLAIGGGDYPPRYERLAALGATIAAYPGHGRFKKTVGGVVVEWRDGAFQFYRESGRSGLPTVKVGAGYAGLWDGRFRVALGREVPGGLELGPLGEADRVAIGARAGKYGAPALAALPAIRRRDTLISAPLLGFSAAPGFPVTVRSVLAERLAEPPRFPDAAGS